MNVNKWGTGKATHPNLTKAINAVEQEKKQEQESKLKQLNVRIDAELLTELKLKSISKNQKLQDAISDAIRLYLSQ
ncbi:hypothetical protein A1D22_10915 [Pasteurellaceae bacterium LFhippo2]|nr:hypothetical protein [Pasteurellaceae bacterium LFhippo2]